MSKNSKELKVKYYGKGDFPKRKKSEKPSDVSTMGYRDDSPYRSLPYIDIHTPDGTIDMSATGIPLWANGRILPPYSGIHQFDTTQVKEIPLAQKGRQTRKLQPWEYVDKEGKIWNDMAKIPLDPQGRTKYAESLDWMKNWISQRKPQMLSLMKGHMAEMDEKYPVDAWARKYIYSPLFGKASAYKLTNEWGEDDLGKLVNQKLNKAIGNINTVQFVDDSKIAGDTYTSGLGSYSPYSHRIKFSWPDENVQVHEIGHSSKLEEESVVRSFIRRTIENDPVYKKNRDPYYHDPGEIYSRIWELRRGLNIKPNEKITKESLKKKLEKEKDRYDIDEYINIFRHLDTDTIINLLNGLVYQENTSKEEIPLAQKGLIVNDPNDPRLKAYQDSSRLNAMYPEVKGYWKPNEMVPEYFNKLTKKYSKGKIKPIGVNPYKVDSEDLHLPVFKKPVQPVTYQPLPSVAESTSSAKPVIVPPTVDEIMMPSGQMISRKEFIKRYGQAAWDRATNQGRYKKQGGSLPMAQDGQEVYNMERAKQLYTPDETGHWPSIDYETGEWLKSKEHPTAWMEYLYGYTLNPQQALNYNVRTNPQGYFGENTLQYVPKQQKGGWLDRYQTAGEKKSDYLYPERDPDALQNMKDKWVWDKEKRKAVRDYRSGKLNEDIDENITVDQYGNVVSDESGYRVPMFKDYTVKRITPPDYNFLGDQFPMPPGIMRDGGQLPFYQKAGQIRYKPPINNAARTAILADAFGWKGFEQDKKSSNIRKDIFIPTRGKKPMAARDWQNAAIAQGDSISTANFTKEALLHFDDVYELPNADDVREDLEMLEDMYIKNISTSIKPVSYVTRKDKQGNTYKIPVYRFPKKNVVGQYYPERSVVDRSVDAFWDSVDFMARHTPDISIPDIGKWWGKLSSEGVSWFTDKPTPTPAPKTKSKSTPTPRPRPVIVDTRKPTIVKPDGSVTSRIEPKRDKHGFYIDEPVKKTYDIESEPIQIAPIRELKSISTGYDDMQPVARPVPPAPEFVNFTAAGYPMINVRTGETTEVPTGYRIVTDEKGIRRLSEKEKNYRLNKKQKGGWLDTYQPGGEQIKKVSTEQTTQQNGIPYSTFEESISDSSSGRQYTRQTNIPGKSPYINYYSTPGSAQLTVGDAVYSNAPGYIKVDPFMSDFLQKRVDQTVKQRGGSKLPPHLPEAYQKGGEEKGYEVSNTPYVEGTDWSEGRVPVDYWTGAPAPPRIIQKDLPQIEITAKKPARKLTPLTEEEEEITLEDIAKKSTEAGLGLLFTMLPGKLQNKLADKYQSTINKLYEKSKAGKLSRSSSKAGIASGAGFDNLIQPYKGSMYTYGDLLKYLETSAEFIEREGNLMIDKIEKGKGLSKLATQLRKADPDLTENEAMDIAKTRLEEVRFGLQGNRPAIVANHIRTNADLTQHINRNDPVMTMVMHHKTTTGEDFRFSDLDDEFPVHGAFYSHVPNIDVARLFYNKQPTKIRRTDTPEQAMFKRFADPSIDPGSFSMGPTFLDRATLAHEIGHAIQRGGITPLDDEIVKMLNPSNKGDKLWRKVISLMDKYKHGTRGNWTHPAANIAIGKGIQDDFNYLHTPSTIRGDSRILADPSYDRSADPNIDWNNARPMEPFAFLREDKQAMIDMGILNDVDDVVTPSKLRKFFWKEFKEGKRPNYMFTFGMPGRITRMTPPWKYKWLADKMNEAPQYLMPTIGAGAGYYMLNNQDGESIGDREFTPDFKKGGWLGKYQTGGTPVSPEELDWMRSELGTIPVDEAMDITSIAEKGYGYTDGILTKQLPIIEVTDKRMTDWERFKNRLSGFSDYMMNSKDPIGIKLRTWMENLDSGSDKWHKTNIHGMTDIQKRNYKQYQKRLKNAAYYKEMAEKDPKNYSTDPRKSKNWRRNLAIQTSVLKDKLELFPEMYYYDADPQSPTFGERLDVWKSDDKNYAASIVQDVAGVLSYFNPTTAAMMLTPELAENLGQAPYKAQLSNSPGLVYTQAIGEPLAIGFGYSNPMFRNKYLQGAVDYGIIPTVEYVTGKASQINPNKPFLSIPGHINKNIRKYNKVRPYEAYPFILNPAELDSATGTYYKKGGDLRKHQVGGEQVAVVDDPSLTYAAIRAKQQDQIRKLMSDKDDMSLYSQIGTTENPMLLPEINISAQGERTLLPPADDTYSAGELLTDPSVYMAMASAFLPDWFQYLGKSKSAKNVLHQNLFKDFGIVRRGESKNPVTMEMFRNYKGADRDKLENMLKQLEDAGYSMDLSTKNFSKLKTKADKIRYVKEAQDMFDRIYNSPDDAGVLMRQLIEDTKSRDDITSIRHYMFNSDHASSMVRNGQIVDPVLVNDPNISLWSTREHYVPESSSIHPDIEGISYNMKNNTEVILGNSNDKSRRGKRMMAVVHKNAGPQDMRMDVEYVRDGDKIVFNKIHWFNFVKDVDETSRVKAGDLFDTFKEAAPRDSQIAEASLSTDIYNKMWNFARAEGTPWRIVPHNEWANASKRSGNLLHSLETKPNVISVSVPNANGLYNAHAQTKLNIDGMNMEKHIDIQDGLLKATHNPKNPVNKNMALSLRKDPSNLIKSLEFQNSSLETANEGLQKQLEMGYITKEMFDANVTMWIDPSTKQLTTVAPKNTGNIADMVPVKVSEHPVFNLKNPAKIDNKNRYNFYQIASDPTLRNKWENDIDIQADVYFINPVYEKQFKKGGSVNNWLSNYE